MVNKLVGIKNDPPYCGSSCLQRVVRSGPCKVLARFPSSSVALVLIGDILHKNDEIGVGIASSLGCGGRTEVHTRIRSGNGANLAHLQPFLVEGFGDHHGPEDEIEFGCGGYAGPVEARSEGVEGGGVQRYTDRSADGVGGG